MPIDAGHDEMEARDYWLLTEPDYLGFINPESAWREVGSIGMVVRQRTIEGVTMQETGYCLLSGSPTIERFATAVRGHWGIENQVHWVLDVTFHEDASRIRTGDGAQNYAVLSHIALNLLRREASGSSVRSKRFRAALDDAYLLQVLHA